MHRVLSPHLPINTLCLCYWCPPPPPYPQHCCLQLKKVILWAPYLWTVPLIIVRNTTAASSFTPNFTWWQTAQKVELECPLVVEKLNFWRISFFEGTPFLLIMSYKYTSCFIIKHCSARTFCAEWADCSTFCHSSDFGPPNWSGSVPEAAETRTICGLQGLSDSTGHAPVRALDYARSPAHCGVTQVQGDNTEWSELKCKERKKKDKQERSWDGSTFRERAPTHPEGWTPC